MPKSFRVATEGATTDGREIQREWIEQMATNYDPKKYGARVWMEHIRGITADSVFNALGDVLSVEAREVEDGKLALFAEIDPTDELKAMNKKRQKVYSSIEVNPKFGDTGEAYLEGLAVTDSPASLGTEMLTFSREKGAASPLAARKQHANNLFTEAVEIELDFTEEKPPAAEGLKAKIASLFKRHDTKTTQGFEAFRTELIGELAGMARLPADDLRQMYAQTPAKTNRPADNKTNNKNKAQDIRVTQVSRALALLLADTTLASGVGDIAALRESHVRGAEILTQAIEFFANNPTIAVSRWLERYRDHRFFDRLQQIASTTPPGSEAARAQEFNEAIARLSTQTASRSSLRKRYDALVARLAEGPLGSEAAQELEHVRRELQGTRHDTT